MLCSVVRAQSFLLDMVFTIGKVQTIFCRQHLTRLFISAEVVLVANRFAVIVHSIKDDVAMWMFTVDVPGNDVLCVLNPHQHHIVMGNL